MSKLSIAMITKDAQKTIETSIKSALFADEVVVIDSGSSDNTIDICKSLGCKVIQKEWMGFGRQKQYAIKECKNEWIFVLDIDEMITKELRDEILSAIDSKTSFNGYKVARLNYFFGKPIKHCGLYPDYTVRLFKKGYGKFSDDEVHEKLIIQGDIGTLKNHMIHYAYENIEDFIAKQNRYSSLNAKQNRLKATVNPYWTFFKIYFLKKGFLDGWRGFIIAKLYAQYTFWKYIK
jgi:glycosyltransferase involved in cell wall biosynthesis